MKFVEAKHAAEHFTSGKLFSFSSRLSSGTHRPVFRVCHYDFPRKGVLLLHQMCVMGDKSEETKHSVHSKAVFRRAGFDVHTETWPYRTDVASRTPLNQKLKWRE